MEKRWLASHSVGLTPAIVAVYTMACGHGDGIPPQPIFLGSSMVERAAVNR